jgi:serine/threonine-protein kinase RsbW
MPLQLALEVTIPSDVSEIPTVVELIQGRCRELALTPRQCSFNVPVALTEAISNAILRGNHEDPEKQVVVRASVDEKSVVLDVVDEGEGFDLEASMADPTTPENITREDGRGLFLMRRLVDRVERFYDHGNVVRLVLNRA